MVLWRICDVRKCNYMLCMRCKSPMHMMSSTSCSDNKSYVCGVGCSGLGCNDRILY